jgi:hypothetical protein
MFSIKSCAIPESALLNSYLKEGTYTDSNVKEEIKWVSILEMDKTQFCINGV